PGHLAKLQDSKAKKEIADSALRTLFPSRATRLFPTDQIELLMWLGCIVPFAIIAHPQTPIFGGTKHWMNGIPFVALFAAVAMNLLRLIGQHTLNTPDSPMRHAAKRRRIKTVMQELMFKAARMLRHAGRWVLGLGQNDSAFTVFEHHYGQLTGSCG
ncbi:MAG: hypothetical protein WCH97_07435, partial [Actinomycetes bacterium]